MNRPKPVETSAVRGDFLKPRYSRRRLRFLEMSSPVSPRLQAVRRLLIPAFALLIVLIAGILIASMTVARSLHKSSNESFVGDAIPLKAAVQDLVLQMVNQQTGQRGYVITANRNVLEPYYAGREATRTDLATIDRLLARHPRMASLVERARPQIASLERFYGEQIALVDSGPAGQARAAQRITELGDVQFNRFRATARLMLADTDKFVQDAKRSQDTRYTTILIFIGVVGAAALLIAAGLAVWTLRHTNAHVEELDAARTRAEESLAGERRATAEVDTLVGRFQESLLPVVGVTDPRVRLATIYRPGEERLQLGGDFYDFLELPNGSLAMLIGDVTGHGPNAAALGASLRTAWRALILDETDLGELPRLMQRLLGLERETEESFATACYGSVDETRSSLSVVLAGHPAPLLLDGDDCVAVEAPIGPPLGVVDEAAWRPRTIELPDRPTVVFFTDGLMEGRADPGSAERFGVERIRKLLSETRSRPLDVEALDRLVNEATRANGAPLPDDVAVLAVSILDDAGSVRSSGVVRARSVTGER